MVNSNLTEHARKRCQQRGITRDVIQCVRDYGEEYYSTRGATRYQLTKRSQIDAINDGCYNKQTIEKALRVYVISYGADDVTWEHCTKKYFRNYTGQRGRA